MFCSRRDLAKDSSDQLPELIQRANIGRRCMKGGSSDTQTTKCSWKRGFQPRPTWKGSLRKIGEGLQHRVIKGRGGIFDEVWWARAESKGDFRQSQTRPEDGGFHLNILDVRKSFQNFLYLLHPLQHGCLTVGTWANRGAKDVNCKPRSD